MSDRSYGLWGHLSFGWVDGPIKKARKNELELENLYLPKEAEAAKCYSEFERTWNANIAPDAKKLKNPLLSSLWSLYGRQFLIGGFFKLGWSFFVISGAFFFVRSLLMYVDEDEDDHPFVEDWTGWPLAIGFFVASVLWGLCLQRMGFICMNSGVKVRAALTTAITRKAIGLGYISADNASRVVSFMANDINKIYDGMQEFHYLWASPIEAFTIIALLAILVKAWALPAAGIVGFILFIQYFFGWQIAVNKVKGAKLANQRASILQEILPAMKLVKYYAWEDFLEEKIANIRKHETKLAATNIFFKTINICLVFTTPPLCASVIFATYELYADRLSSTIAFTTLTLFNIMRFPLVVLPKALRAASEAQTSLKRIEEFLLDPQTHDAAAFDGEADSIFTKEAIGVEMHDAVLQYEGHDGHGFKLSVPRFDVRPGEVVAVVGRVGAGKTAMLDALLGNMPIKGGHVRVGGRIAYVPQTAWVQNMSIKDNITFGLPFDQARYDATVHACSLTADFDMLPSGDQSMGGLRGMNLSGGQRQRVNVARATYFNADTILLDNALSAVDHHTAEHMFSHCVRGMMRDKTVVLVTHQLQFIRRCDKVCIMDHGKVQYFGPFTGQAQTILSRYMPVPDEDTGANHAAESKKKVATTVVKAKAQIEAPPKTSLKMGAAFWQFMRAGRAWACIISVCTGLVSQASRQMSDFWIRSWVNDRYERYDQDEDGNDINGGDTSRFYAGIYGALTFAFFAIQVIRTGGFFTWGLVAANRVLKRSIHRVFNAPMGFFLAKPVGELLSTFSSDQDRADENLIDVLHLAFVYGFIILSTAVTVSINIFEFIAFLACLLALTGLMLYLYLPAATKMKALRATTAGELVGLAAEVLEGLKLVQAYRHEEHFIEEFRRRTDNNHKTVFNADSLNLWVSFRCDFYGSIMLLAICTFAVAEKDRGSAVVGLAFSNTIQLLVFYTWTLRLITESVSLAGSVEQLTWLAKSTPIDGQDDVNNAGQGIETGIKWKELKKIVIANKKQDIRQNRALKNWPIDGRIVFSNVHMRYKPSAGFALDGVNLSVKHGETVGIVGRTGSGKSSLLMGLFRMFELAEGNIQVGGVDISMLPLKKARRGMSIIPQEPVMFSGTLRENLDPYHEHSDFELYNLLVEVGLREQAEQAGGLDGHVHGSGNDQWSVGQCQLVCLIRAALNKVPIVCMDEATAALDPHTEAAVLEAAGRLFNDRTLLTVAHRLEAVISCDTVVVMERGKVAETGAPDTLLANRASWFSKLVDMAGPAESAALRAEAARHFAERTMAEQEAMAMASVGPQGVSNASASYRLQ